MKDININLQINDENIEVGHILLERIVQYIPDIKGNEKVFEILALSNRERIKYYLADKKNLNEKTVSLLLNESDNNIVDLILSNVDAAKHITQKQIMKFFKNNCIELLCTIARNIEIFKKCDIYKLIKMLSKHENPRVRYNLLQSKNSELITKRILKKLSKDEDIDVSNFAKKFIHRISNKVSDNKICFCDF